MSNIWPMAAADCTSPLHAYPLASGEGWEEAHRRLRMRWKNLRCGDCGLYGWVIPPPDEYPKYNPLARKYWTVPER